MDRRKASHSEDRSKSDQDRHRRDRKPTDNRTRDASIKSRHDREAVPAAASRKTTTKRTSDVETNHPRTRIKQLTSTTNRLSVDDVRHPSKQSTSSSSRRLTENSEIDLEKLRRSRRRNSDSIKKSKDTSNNNDVRGNGVVNVTSTSRRQSKPRNDPTVLEIAPKNVDVNDSHEYEEDFEDYESDFDQEPVSDNENGNHQEEVPDGPEVPGEIDIEHPHVSQDLDLFENVEKFENEPNSSVDARFHKEDLTSSQIPVQVNELAVSERQTVQEPDSDKLQPNLNELNFIKKPQPGHGGAVGIKSHPKTKSTKRGEELLDLIKLDDVGYGLFSLSPRTYDEFMRNFGNDNSKQAYSQTGDEKDVEETQTDPVELSDAWTQHPPGIHGAIGGKQLPSKSSNPYEMTSSKNWKRLGRFLHQASQIMCSLIEEEHSETQDSKLVSVEKDVGFSERTLYLRPPLFLQGYSALFVSSCRLQPHFILVIYARVSPKRDNVAEDQKQITCVWNVHKPNEPQKVLTSSCQPLCCCFSRSAEFAFAGFEDGSVAVWDLREPDNLHQRFSCEGGEYVCRSPTYSTAEVLGSDGHLSPVVAILCRADKNSPSGSAHYNDGIIQLATLEEDGVLLVWVLSETSHPDIAGDETELGLAPGGKVQLVKSSSVRLQSISKLQQHLQTYPRVKDFACHAQDANRYYVTTDTGVVVTCTVHDEKSSIFVPSEGTSATAEANSISFAIDSEPQCFLVGCEDGSVRLHSVAKANPLMTWTAASKAGEAIHKVAWSESCPNVFYLLDCLGQVHVWDLCESDCEPASSTNAANKRVRHFDVGIDRRLWNATDTSYKPYIVFGCDDGTTEVHYVNDRYTRRGDKEKQMFRKYVELL